MLDCCQLVGMGWTEGELLVIVLRDGTVLLYDVLGRFVQTFLLLLPASPSEDNITEICLWGSGIVALTGTMALQVCDDVTVTSPSVYRMSTGLSPRRPATSMVVLQPCFTSSGLVEVILGTSDSTVLVVDTNGPEDQLLQQRIQAPVISMAIAPNGRFLACFTASGILTVMSTSFTTKVLDFDTSTTSKPLQMQWCGEDSLIMYWEHFLLMVGPYGHWLRFPYAVPLCLISELDCCRIISSTNCELLQRVPGPIESIHRIGSTDPSAMLYDAMEAFEDGDPKADETMRSMELTGQLGFAIQTNISAAAAEILPTQQKLYLRAAIYGQGFSGGSEFTDHYIAAARKLRILNQLRRHVPAMCLTSAQYDRSSPTVLVDRLLARNEHTLAMSISKYLGIRRDRVVVHWACAMLRGSAACASLDETMVNKLQTSLKLPGSAFSYTQIAATADLIGRRRLATMLLESDFNTTEQVKLLLTMKECGLALEKALKSMEVDLIYLALLSMQRAHHLISSRSAWHGSETKASFAQLIERSADSANLMRVYYESSTQARSHEILHNFLSSSLGSTGLHLAGNFAVGQCYQQSWLRGRLKKMREATSLFAQGRELQFHLRACEEQMQLLKLQGELELKFGVTCFVDMSVSETIYNLIALGATQCRHAATLLLDASRVQKRFKVPDHRFLHIRVKALAASGQWQALKSFAGEKKPIIGYAPFVRVCVQHCRSVSEIDAYLNRVVIPEERISLCSELNLWRHAAESAMCSGDKYRLLEIRKACTDASVVARIDESLASISILAPFPAGSAASP